MCRYGMVVYKEHFACFECRKAFKQPFARNAELAPHQGYTALCLQCRTPMAALGLDFKAPAQRDVMQWRKVERLYELGIAFHSCGCSGPGARPATLQEIEPFLAEGELCQQATEKATRLMRGERKWHKAQKDLAARRMQKLIAAQQRNMADF